MDMYNQKKVLFVKSIKKLIAEFTIYSFFPFEILFYFIAI